MANIEKKGRILDVEQIIGLLYATEFSLQFKGLDTMRYSDGIKYLSEFTNLREPFLCAKVNGVVYVW